MHLLILWYNDERNILTIEDKQKTYMIICRYIIELL